MENTNCRVRCWLLRDNLLLDLPRDALSNLCARMNATLRKCLGYRTLAEVFRE